MRKLLKADLALAFVIVCIAVIRSACARRSRAISLSSESSW